MEFAVEAQKLLAISLEGSVGSVSYTHLANEENFTVTIEKKVKPEGAKRPKLVEENITFAYDEIKYTKSVSYTHLDVYKRQVL